MAVEQEPTSPQLSGRLIALGIAALLLAVFLLSNLDSTEVSFLWFDSDVSLAVALAVAALVGLAIGYFTGRQAGRRARRR